MSDTAVATQKKLFTPGPLTTSERTKQAMQNDYGSRDAAFVDIVQNVRNALLQHGGVSKEQGYECVIMQGAGTFGVESVITSSIPQNGHLLVIVNGAYGDRIVKMADIAELKYSIVRSPEDETPDLQNIEGLLKNEPGITHVAMVHCETTTGIINPIKEVGALVKKYGKAYIVDAMSSFGGVPLNMADCQIDYLVSSSNKCVEGVPGFSFALCQRDELEKCQGNARSLSLDLFAQWKGLEKNGQFRFTPPTHSIAAYWEALQQLEEEGGVSARAERYRNNYNTLVAGMRDMGFKEYLPAEKQGWIITSFYYPESPNFDFAAFYAKLNERNYVIYPGKLSNADCFRIGNIGQIFEEDIHGLLAAIKEVLAEMQVEMS